MRIELHLHTNRYSPCAIVNPRQVLQRLYEAGYDAAFITEHDEVWSTAELVEIRAEFPRMLILPGMELSIGAGASQHLLVLGTNDPTYLNLSDPAEVIGLARRRNHLTVLAHPFRWPGGGDVLEGDVLPDAVEYRTPNQQGDAARLAGLAARSLQLPMVNSGDVHGLQQVGRYWIETYADVASADDVRDAVRQGAYENREDRTERRIGLGR